MRVPFLPSGGTDNICATQFKKKFLRTIYSQAGEAWPGRDVGRQGTGGKGDAGRKEGRWPQPESFPGSLKGMHFASTLEKEDGLGFS